MRIGITGISRQPYSPQCTLQISIIGRDSKQCIATLYNGLQLKYNLFQLSGVLSMDK